MTNNSTGSTANGIVFDGWRSIIISLYMSLAGYTVMVSVPMLSTAMVGLLDLTAE